MFVLFAVTIQIKMSFNSSVSQSFDTDSFNLSICQEVIYDYIFKGALAVKLMFTDLTQILIFYL